MEIEGKTALITGASSGIGAATARAFAAAGARVILLARRVTELGRHSAPDERGAGMSRASSLWSRVRQARLLRVLAVYLAASWSVGRRHTIETFV